MTSLFSKINNWNDFNSALMPLNNKEKGDAFELLSKLYFLIVTLVSQLIQEQILQFRTHVNALSFLVI